MVLAAVLWGIYGDVAGYSALLGPVIGIILVDYYLIRRTRLDVTDLYRHNGQYAGINRRAIIALVLGVLPNLPGFLAQVGVITVQSDTMAMIVGLYSYAWFIGLAIAGIIYYLLMRKHPTAQPGL